MAYLLSRGLDPLLGIFTGLLAFRLHEHHPRTGLREEERLLPLLRWKWAQKRKLKEGENDA
ncbi:hypothetical protein BDZ89DRAFT_1125488 [Hymenopellis radicata]|nr:hypothetical protein BDZ89DRAFT_1125488 [Hymenopellis radicata]